MRTLARSPTWHSLADPPLASASPSTVTVNEVEALHELFKRVSNSLFVDGLIHREEFCLALFKTAKAENLFANRVRAERHAARACSALASSPRASAPAPTRRACMTPVRVPHTLPPQVFEIFDQKKNNVIEFGEFVHSLSVFHPKASVSEKAECASPCAALLRSAPALTRSRPQSPSAFTTWAPPVPSTAPRFAPC